MKCNIKLIFLLLVIAFLSTGCSNSGLPEQSEKYCGEGGDFSVDGAKFIISFDKYPNGTSVIADTASPPNDPDGPFIRVNGDEYTECGITIATSWNNLGYPNWGLLNSCVVIHTDYYGTGSFLVRENEPNCSSRVLHITFSSPVKGISIQFIGASVNYSVVAYDQNGIELGRSTHQSEFVPDVYPRQIIEYESDQNNIKSIRFYGISNVSVGEAIEKLIFTRD